MSSPKWYRVKRKDGSWSKWYRSASAASNVESGVLFQYDGKEREGREYGASAGGVSFPKPEKKRTVSKIHRVQLDPDEYRPQKNKFRRTRSKHGLSYVQGSGYDWEGDQGTLSAHYDIDEEEHLRAVHLSWKGDPESEAWKDTLEVFGVESSRVSAGVEEHKAPNRKSGWFERAKKNVDRVLDSMENAFNPMPRSMRAKKRKEMLEWGREMDEPDEGE